MTKAHSEVRDILRFVEVEHLLGHASHWDFMHDIIAHTLTEVEMCEKP